MLVGGTIDLSGAMRCMGWVGVVVVSRTRAALCAAAKKNFSKHDSRQTREALLTPPFLLTGFSRNALFSGAAGGINNRSQE